MTESVPWASAKALSYILFDRQNDSFLFIRPIRVIRGSLSFSELQMALHLEKETYEILGACFEIYNQMGCGFVESVYHRCLLIELTQRGIPFESKVPLALVYKGQSLELKFVPDLVCFGSVIVEIKAVSDLNDVFRAQVHNYLKATSLRIGLLANFGSHPKLEYERIIR